MKKYNLFISTHNPVINGGVLKMMTFAGNQMSRKGLNPYFIFPSHSLKDCFTMNIARDKVDRFSATRYFSFPFIESIKFLIPALYKNKLSSKAVYHGIGGTSLTALPLMLKSKKYVVWTATTVKSEFLTQLEIFKYFQPYYLLNLLFYPVNRYLEGMVYKKAARIMALSSFTAENIKKEFRIPENKIEIINIPVELERFQFRERNLEKIQNKRKRVLFVGRLDDPRKNVTLLIEVIKNLVEDGLDIELILAGAAKHRKLFVLKQKLESIKNNCKLYISVSDQVLKKLYDEADIFVLSSKQEGQGIVLLEAMASGIPVVSTRCGGPESFIENRGNGILVKNNSVKDMTEALRELINDSILYNRLSITGRRTVEQRFSIEAISAKMFGVYNQIYPELLKGL